MVWTTIATGKTPDQHGIGHFVAVNDKTGEQLPVTSAMRKVKAVWNILSDAGRSGGGGRLVGDLARREGERRDRQRPHLLPLPLPAGPDRRRRTPQGLTHPPELLARLAPLVRRPGGPDPRGGRALRRA